LTAADRAARTQEADRLCRSAFSSAEPPEEGVALVAVGGYGRGELAPYSDLDIVLVHEAAVDVRELAQRLWYPLWDANVTIDHSVRALTEVTEAAAADVRVALGLLDARHVAGDPTVTLHLRTGVLARWRRDARQNLPRLREVVRERWERGGELAHAAVPDIKESAGGLRDATVLKALVASWLVDVPHTDLERCRLQLLDIRDVLQAAAGRATDRVVPEMWPVLAEGLGLAGEHEAQRLLRQIGRRSAHLSRLTWSRADRLLAPRTPGAKARAPELTPIAPGVAVSSGEVVLDRGANPAADPLLLLRAAEGAAVRGMMLAPPTAARLAASAPTLTEPWPYEARDLFVRLLAAGPGLLAVWETLDETGALDLLLPEWRGIRLLPHATPVHRYTVDRHAVETCIEAARLIRRVERPDLLLVAALLHDIGKGGRVDHSVAGEPVAARVAIRMGFGAEDAATVARLVRWHLLLSETATTRDLDDPATAELVAGRVADLATLELLEVLTEADARATSPQAWTRWRSGLVASLADRVRRRLVGAPSATPAAPEDVDASVPGEAHGDPSYLLVEVSDAADGCLLTVTAADRVGLMADVAGTLALMRTSVRSARAWTVDGVAVSQWQVAGDLPEPAIVRRRLESVVSRSVDPAERLRGRSGQLPPSVAVRHDASQEATVLEVRTDDRPGVVFLTCRALASLGLTVRSAHVDTIGPQALDVFYVQEQDAGALPDERAASAAHAVRRDLERAATLDA
jgi:[protein-PII] uridylyltransferase